MRKRKMIATGLLVFLFFNLVGCGQQTEEAGIWGRVESKEVDINSKIPGRVVKILVQEGQEVKAGQVLARIDKRDLLAKLRQAQAQSKSLEAQVSQAGTAVELQETTTQSGIQSAAAQVQNALVDLQLAQKNYQRFQELYNSGAISEKNLDEVRAKCQATQNIYAQSQAALAAAKANYSQGTQINRENQAAVASKLTQARAAVDEISLLLEETEIKAPIDGIVTSLIMEEGELVSAGMSLMAVMDPQNNWVNLKVKETELSKYRLNDKVTLQGRDKGFKIQGTIVDISKKPEFATYRATNERGDTDLITFNVKIQVNSEAIRPGMRFQILSKETGQ